MKRLIASLLTLTGALVLAACATTGGASPGALLSGWCPTAQSELQAFNAIAPGEFSANAQNALSAATAGVATMCTPAAIAAATSGNVQQFTQIVLPALTVIGVEYAALMQKKLDAAKKLSASNAAPIAMVM
jgi:hypothetical protein